MLGIRRHIRAWTLTWLAFHAASLSAFVPRDCCAAHKAHASHDAVTTDAGADEAQCPMHQSADPEPDCSLRGACNGPRSALPAVWSTPSPVPASFTIALDTSSSSWAAHADARPVANDVLPDPPPPRA
ncbi:MAG: hypothetical protein ACRD15_04325 [Vicinamibacterales bacterium]